MLIARRDPFCHRDIVVLAKVSKLHSLMMVKSPYPVCQMENQDQEMPLAFIPFALLLLPLAEIAVFIFVGSHIGILPTIAIVVLSAVCGALLLRTQGLATLSRLRAELDAGRLPGRELADGVMILAAAVLLITPGFVTDAIGFTLMVPAVRAAIWRKLASRAIVFRTDTRPSHGKQSFDDDVIDLESEEFAVQDDARPTGTSSPWKRS
jgi:UPF0716 protein FxsA